MDKTLGERKVKHNYSNNEDSRSVHYKENKLRGGRRKADRNTHHRRRRVMKDAIAHGHYDHIIPSSTGQVHNRGYSTCGGSQHVLKSKSTIGCREDFYLSAPNGKSHPTPSWRMQEKIVSSIPLTSYWNDVYKVRSIYMGSDNLTIYHRNWEVKKGEKVEMKHKCWSSGPVFDKIIKV